MRKLSLALSAAALSTAAAPAIAADLTVSVEIPRVSGASYHRPYVAVWIERPDNTAVRTLAVWYQQTANAEGDGKAATRSPCPARVSPTCPPATTSWSSRLPVNWADARSYASPSAGVPPTRPAPRAPPNWAPSASPSPAKD